MDGLLKIKNENDLIIDITIVSVENASLNILSFKSGEDDISVTLRFL